MKDIKTQNKAPLQKTSWNLFRAGQLLLSMRLALEYYNILSTAPLGKTEFLFPQNSHFQVASRLKLGTGAHLLFSVLSFLSSFRCAGPVHAVTVCVSSCVHWSCCVWRMLFPGSCLLPLALTVFLPPFLAKLPEPWEERFDEDISFRAECSKVFHSFCIVQFWVSILISIYCKKKLFSWGLSNVLIYGDSNMLLGVSLLLCPFNRIIVKSFSLGPMT